MADRPDKRVARDEEGIAPVTCGRCETRWTVRPDDRECPHCGCQWVKG